MCSHSERADIFPAARGRIFLRADASSATGFGHFVRSASLGGYLSDIFDCTLFTWNKDGVAPSRWMINIAAEAGIRLDPLQGSSLDQANETFLKELEDNDRPIAVLDNYYHSTDYMNAVRDRAKALVSIDDMHTRHFPSDILISFSPLPREAYSMEPYTHYLSGFQWSFLRKPFLRPLPPSGFTRRGIVMAMGGADPLHLTSAILPMLHKVFPDEPVEVIAGDSVKLPDDIDMMPRTVVHRRLDAGRIADIFDRCRLGIFPASTICMEALARHLPIAAGHFTDNQIEVYASGVEKGYFQPLGDLTLLTPERLAEVKDRISSADGNIGQFPDFRVSRDEIRNIFSRLCTLRK